MTGIDLDFYETLEQFYDSPIIYSTIRLSYDVFPAVY